MKISRRVVVRSGVAALVVGLVGVSAAGAAPQATRTLTMRPGAIYTINCANALGNTNVGPNSETVTYGEHDDHDHVADDDDDSHDTDNNDDDTSDHDHHHGANNFSGRSIQRSPSPCGCRSQQTTHDREWLLEPVPRQPRRRASTPSWGSTTGRRPLARTKIRAVGTGEFQAACNAGEYVMAGGDPSRTPRPPRWPRSKRSPRARRRRAPASRARTTWPATTGPTSRRVHGQRPRPGGDHCGRGPHPGHGGQHGRVGDLGYSGCNATANADFAAPSVPLF